MIFFHYESKFEIFFFGGGVGRVRGRRRGRWMDRQTGLNQFASSNSSKLKA